MPVVTKNRNATPLYAPAILAVCSVICLAWCQTPQAQVAIVPNQPKSEAEPRPRGRRPRQKAAVKGVVRPAEKTAGKPAGESLKGRAFPIVKPPMEEIVAPGMVPSAEPKPSRPQPDPPAESSPAADVATIAGLAVTADAAPAVMPEAPGAEKPVGALLSYEFKVITSDPRGRVLQVGREQRRYFSETLPGGVTLDLTEISGGTSLIGSSDLEIGQGNKNYARDLGKKAREKVLDRMPAEGPQRLVRVRTFYLGKLEITQAQWRAVAEMPRVKRDLTTDPSQFKGDNRPVESVSWDEAMEFCARLSRATGRKYRLPTEAEWEYAARAGSGGPFHFGPAISAELANFNGRRPLAGLPGGKNRETTIPAGSLGAANRFGLYDMHGNVREWCMDGWHDNYRGAPGDARLWEENAVAYLKVVRGGGWDSAAVECRLSYRDRMTAMLRTNNVGFRVALEIEPAGE
jgi:formylglycine-generating enzyme required for sulfatase activity